MNSTTTCKKVDRRPIKCPGLPELPISTVLLEQPSASIGVDYSGLLLITTSKNESTKVYIVLFNCTATRGVYLNIAENMKAETFLLIFRRFFAVISAPK